MNRSLPAVCLVTALLASLSPDTAAADSAEDYRAQVEADWALQDATRWHPLLQGPITTQLDAQGACDGVKDGGWGFHTANEPGPWWQVDLGAVEALERLVVYNRVDAAGRAARLMVLLSDDAAQWKQVYQHNGEAFLGATDGKPLVVSVAGEAARFVRLQLPGPEFFHLDEVEVYGVDDPARDLALWQPADQSGLSPWSKPHVRLEPTESLAARMADALRRGRALAADLRGMRVDVAQAESALSQIEQKVAETADPATLQELYLGARWIVRELAFENPLLDFDRVLFAKRKSGSFFHMSDQHYGWWSRPGGGIFVLEGIRSGAPQAREIVTGLPEGSYLSPDLSYDGARLMFAYCRHFPEVAGLPDKQNKENVPEEAFYHVFEIKVDGTGLRQLTFGRYDDFDARYLPNAEIVFLSTRRGTFPQCNKTTAMLTLTSMLPDSYVRCGGDAYRPVSVYTLHVMDAEGGDLRAISPFENFEWTPSVSADGRILYARWDYVDRSNMPFMGLWSTNPDGTNPQAVYGNFTWNPHCVFEAKSIPGSSKLIFTASAHHAVTGGSLVLLDPDKAVDGDAAMTRLTPEVCFPESEGWPHTFYANPWPLSEGYYLTSWSARPLNENSTNGLGLYLFDAFGNLELLYRDPDIASMYPIPLMARPMPPTLPHGVDWDGPQEGRFLLLNVHEGLPGVGAGEVTHLRIVGVPAKVQPVMNSPNLGVTADDPGKFVLGTVPVEADGSAYFRAPSGVPLFFQALDRDGLAVQTMRTVTYLQPGETLSCIGCHEERTTAPPFARPLAAERPASKITSGPEGSWPLRYDRLVQPVLDAHCVSCHRPDGSDPKAAAVNMAGAGSYDVLLSYGSPSLREHVSTRYHEGRSRADAGAAQESALLVLLRDGHHGVQLDGDGWRRLVTWVDTYGQRVGSYSEEQEQRLLQFRADAQELFAEP